MKPIVRADCKKSVLWIPILLWIILGSIVVGTTAANGKTPALVCTFFLAFCLWQTGCWVPMAFTRIEAFPDYLAATRFGRPVLRLEYSKIDALPQRSGHSMTEYRVRSNGKTVLRFTDSFSCHEALYDLICCKVIENRCGVNSPEASRQRASFEMTYKRILSK